MRGTIKRIHIQRRDAYAAAINDFYREGGQVSVEVREDYKNALVAADNMSNREQMAMYDLRDFGPLPKTLGCYHAFATGGMEYIEFFLEDPEIAALNQYMSNGTWEKEEGAK